MLGDEENYVDGDILFVIEQPDGTTIDTATMEKKNLKSQLIQTTAPLLCPNSGDDIASRS